ncbi:MAG TPA: DsbA family protein [Longimicrobium sp.]
MPGPSQERWLNLAVAVLVVCAVVTTGLVARRELRPTPSGANAAAPRSIREWRDYAAHGHRRGAAGAPVTIVMFSDFQCPFCRATAGALDSLRGRYGSQLAVVYRHYPLPNHPFALAAARASECAAAQGGFWPFHDALFARQDSIGVAAWSRYAAAARLPDTAAFARCVETPARRADFAADIGAGERLGIRGTPMLLVNGRLFQGALPLPALTREVEDALRHSRRRPRRRAARRRLGRSRPATGVGT